MTKQKFRPPLSVKSISIRVTTLLKAYHELTRAIYLLFHDIVPNSSRWRILLIILMGISLSFVEILFLFSLSNFFQKAQEGNVVFYYAIAMTLLLVLTKYVLYVFYQFSSLKFLTDIKLRLEDKILRHFDSSTLHDALSLSQGSFLHTLRVSVTTISVGGGMSLFGLIVDSALLAALAIFIAHQFGTGVFLLCLIMMALVQTINFIVVTPKYSKSAQKVNSIGREIFSLIGEFFNGIREIRVYQLQNRFLQEFRDLSRFENTSIVKRNLYQDLPRLNFEIIFILVLIFFISVSKYGPAQISVYQLSVISYTILRLVPILGRINSNIGSLMGIGEPLKKIISLKKSLHVMSETAFRPSFSQPIELVSLDIDDVKVSIDGKQISFSGGMKFDVGVPVVITGRSGVGKSTLLNVLSGLIDSESSTFRINGELASRGFLKSNTALVTQSPTFFHGTVYENMLYVAKSEEEISEDFVRYSKALGLWNEIPDLLNKYIGSRDGLSGGQLQRLAIARALISNKRILLLDESTSAQDQVNSENIVDLLFEEADSRIIIFATHRQELIPAFPKHIDLNLLTERPLPW